MPDIKTFKRIMMGLPPKRSVYVMSDHGKGKSSVIAQLAQDMAKRLGKPFGFIDLRLSQREPGDIIGTPRSLDKYLIKMPAFAPTGEKIITEVEATNVMVHDLPLWFPTDPTSCGYLFLDELPYAPKDVLQAIMELALDYRYNFHELPPGWRVIAAGNHKQEIYGGSTINPALWDRFLKILFDPSVPEWLDWGAENNVHRAILTYITKITGDLDPPEEMESGVTYPSRRAWTYLSDDINHMTSLGDDPLKDQYLLTYLAKGRIGDTVGVNWVDYVAKEYKIYSVEEILDKSNDKMMEDFKNMDVPEIAFYTKEIVTTVGKMKKLTAAQSKNLFVWAKAIPQEAASGFWVYFAKTERQIALKWYNETAGVIDYFSSFLIKKNALGDNK